jgi:hypothetical protein
VDSGYCSEKNLKYLAKKKINGFVATGKEKHDEQREPCKRGPVPQRATRVELGRKLESRLGSDLRRTKTDRGPVFRQIKQARGFRQFLLRGGVDLDQVSTTAVPGDEAVDRGLLDKRTGEPEIPCQGVTHMCIRGPTTSGGQGTKAQSSLLRRTERRPGRRKPGDWVRIRGVGDQSISGVSRLW